VGHHDSYTWADLKALRDLVARSPSDTAWEILVDAAYDVEMGTPIEAIIENESDALGHVIAGIILRYHALRARGARIALHTSARQFRSYVSIGVAARNHLERAVELSPSSGLAIGGLASFGLEEDHDGKAASEALLSRVPDVPATAFCDVLQAWSHKWGGSQDEMWACLHRLWRDDDPRSWAMLARATFEENLFTKYFQTEHKNYSGGVFARRGPISLNEASNAALARSDDHSNPGLMRFVHGWLGRVFWERRDLKRAKSHLLHTKDQMNPTIWVYGSIFLSSAQRFRLAKFQAGVR
jgi:hypothetical protein